jgi:peptidoglycan/xylan/chitin deacetylase (PgdA/CDA1 family)
MPGKAMSVLFRTVAGLMSPAGPKGRLSVLIYHRVLSGLDPMQPTVPDEVSFRWQMQLLKDHFDVLPLSEAIRRLQDGALPKRAASITFDDGYADNVSVALPVLQRLGLPATFFIATGYLDGGRMWNDTIIEAVRRARGTELDLSWLGLGSWVVTTEQRYEASATLISRLKHLPHQERENRAAAIADAIGTELPQDLMMRSEQVAMLTSAGMEIGAHTVSHPVLRSLSTEQAQQEIGSGRQRLSEITGKPVELFAYPHGRPGRDYDAQHVRIVRELGFLGAVSTAWGAADRFYDRFQLPRFTPWDQTPNRFLARLLQNYVRGARPVGDPHASETTARAS